MKFPSKSRKILTRDDILGIKDMQIEFVPTPEWPGDIYVRGMSGRDYGEYEAFIIQIDGDNNQVVNLIDARAKMASLTICDKEGNRTLTEDDVKVLSDLSSAPLVRIFKVARKLSGIDRVEIEKLTEGLKENPFGDSVSDSPDTSAE